MQRNKGVGMGSKKSWIPCLIFLMMFCRQSRSSRQWAAPSMTIWPRSPWDWSNYCQLQVVAELVKLVDYIYCCLILPVYYTLNPPCIYQTFVDHPSFLLFYLLSLSNYVLYVCSTHFVICIYIYIYIYIYRLNSEV